jgi:hypothetical protein
VNQVANMSAGTFFGTLAAMMGTMGTSVPLTNPPLLPADAAAEENLKKIGLTRHEATASGRGPKELRAIRRALDRQTA